MNILITRLQNIGDMLAFVPALRLLCQAAPEARITSLLKNMGLHPRKYFIFAPFSAKMDSKNWRNDDWLADKYLPSASL